MRTQHALVHVDPRTAGYQSIDDYHPQKWFGWGNLVVIEPVPDDTYPLMLFRAHYPTIALSDSTSVPSQLPEEFRECIVMFACYVLSMKLGKWRKAFMFYNHYLHELKKRRNDYIRRKAEKRSITHLTDNVLGGVIGKSVDSKDMARIPDNVIYKGGSPWVH